MQGSEITSGAGRNPRGARSKASPLRAAFPRRGSVAYEGRFLRQRGESVVVELDGLERCLWDAANALRGPVDPSDCKNYVSPTLFWKAISDAWDWEHAQAVADYDEAVLKDGAKGTGTAGGLIGHVPTDGSSP